MSHEHLAGGRPKESETISGSTANEPPHKRAKFENQLDPHLPPVPVLDAQPPIRLGSTPSPEIYLKLQDQRTRTSVLTESFGLSWFEALEAEFRKEYFTKLSEFVAAERNKGLVYPPPENVFSWTQFFPIQETNVVILGQDPYHGPRQAHGLCFSVQHGVDCPPSLKNIYKELKTDIPGFVVPNHGNLTGWVNQGVLLLNAVLTVRAGNANSHKDRGWEAFTDAVIRWLNDNLKDVVFILWGKYAQEKGSKINQSAHPSPLSATKFFGCKHFSKTNEILGKCGKEPIKWGDL